jgi:DNA (cytosine-5)-methyltransferase 1
MEEGFIHPAPIWTDLKTFDGRPWRGIVDCIIGGYPCQPFSQAGRRLGKEDPRHLWPYFVEIIKQIQPNFCFFENVEGHLSLGFEQVRSDLQAMGYGVEAGLFSAAEIGASHLRKRLFILACHERTLRGRSEGNSERLSDGLLADARCYGRQQVSGSPHGNEAANEGRTAQEADKSQRYDKDVANTNGSGFGRGNLGGSGASRGEVGQQGNGTSPSDKFGDRSKDVAGSTSFSDGKGREDSPPPKSDETVLADASLGRCEGWGRGEEQGGRSPADVAPCSEVLADTESLRGTEIERLEQDGILSVMGCLQTETGGMLTLFPPKPTDFEAWTKTLEIDPTLEPAICGMANELASGLVGSLRDSRVDKLRLLGNGVIPTCASNAFHLLLAEFV